MTHFYAFNGDADGLCALQQLRLVEDGNAVLVTGVKRDIRLLQRVDAAGGDAVTVLDISHAQNSDDVLRLLRAGASVRYFDHHHAGELPRHPRFDAHIDEASSVCTSILVDRHLGGIHRAWAIVAAFGDGLPEIGRTLAMSARMDAHTVATLEQLGKRLNYNAYGSSVSDLRFDPADLAARMLPFVDPMAFVHESTVYVELGEQFDADMRRAQTLKPALEAPGAVMIVLPDEAWARRAIGVLANETVQARPDCAVAILAPEASAGFTVSVRVPAESPVAADEFCRGFASGNGRKRAAGINRLPAADVDKFAARFADCFRSR